MPAVVNSNTIKLASFPNIKDGINKAVQKSIICPDSLHLEICKQCGMYKFKHTEPERSSDGNWEKTAGDRLVIYTNNKTPQPINHNPSWLERIKSLIKKVTT